MRDLYFTNSDAFMVVLSLTATSTSSGLEEEYLQQIERVRAGKPYGLLIVGTQDYMCECKFFCGALVCLRVCVYFMFLGVLAPRRLCTHGIY